MDAGPARSAARWLPPLLGLVGAALLFYALQPFGIGVTSDCVDYFSTASSLARGEGFVQHDGMPYASWPPLYPMLLALGLKLTIKVETTALIVNLLSVALTIWLASWWSLRQFQNRFLAHWLGLVFLLHFALWDVALHAWTEPLFNLMALVFILRLPDAAGVGRWRDLLGLAVLAAAAWLLRYVGLTLVVLGAVFILFGSHLAWWQRIRRLLAFVLVASLPAALWMLRNWMLMGQAVGERSPSSFDLTQNLMRVAKIAWWIAPESWGKILPAAILALLAILLAVFSFAGRRAKMRRHLGLRSALLLYSALYLALLVASSTRYAYEPIHSRYLMPVLPPLLLWLALWLDDRLASIPTRVLRWSLAGLMTLWLIFPTATSARMIHAARSEGVDVFGAPEWRGWALWDWLKGSPPEGILVSNGADAVHYHTGLPVRLAPRRWMHSTSHTPTRELEDFARIFQEDRPVLYVWIAEFPRTGGRANYHNLDEILDLYRLEPIAHFPEGAVFMVLPREPEIAYAAKDVDI